jgi:hypothetical protein
MVSKNNTLQYDLNEKKLIRLEGFDIIDESEKFNKFMRKIKICNLLYY